MYKTIGILGGMGAEATADVYLKIISLFQTKKKAILDSDFPEFIINSIPLHIVENNLDEQKAITMLTKGCKLIESAGADFIIISCNAAHKFIEPLRKSVKIPILSIPEEVAKVIKKDNREKILVLAAEYTVENHLYEKVFSDYGLEIYYPSTDEQKATNHVILSVISGNKSLADKKRLIDIILKNSPGINGVILGCTELSLVLKREDSAFPLYDTSNILAEAAFNSASEK
jgi:aspartate racemase